ncbi:MAG: 3'-5' exonuclease [Deltaproteobacteria bacterium]|nr:3'-5' exonuclease [Deltaproteobacteria bacterium]
MKDQTFKLVSDIPDDLLSTYLSSDMIAVDTELDGLRPGRDQVCLIQLCDRSGNVCLVRPEAPKAPPNLKRLMTDPKVLKVFHFALSDATFLQSSLGIMSHPYRCTKVMSKLARTYTSSHSLKALMDELLGMTLDKESQQTNWRSKKLTQKQLVYAASDVLNLLKVYDQLKAMIEDRGKMPTGISLADLNERVQGFIPTMVELILNGYGDKDSGWETSIYSH